MKYKISRNNLQKALNEAVLEKKNYYKNLTFIDEIFKEEKDHIKTIKNIIRFKGNNINERLHHYLLHECNCSSKYNKVAQHTNMSPEKDLLYDYDKEDLFKEDYDDFQGYDHDEDVASYDFDIEDALDKFVEYHDREPFSDEELEEFAQKLIAANNHEKDNDQVDFQKDQFKDHSYGGGI